MNYIFLSPHYDDAIFSCGGLIWELRQKGTEVEVCTICAAEPTEVELSPFAQELHRRWGVGILEAVQIRRREDIHAANILGVNRREFPLQDCIYRRSNDGEYLYQSEAALFGDLHPAEGDLILQLATLIMTSLPHRARLIAPLGVGNHVDHQLTRRAAEASGKELWYYADVPYVFRQPGWRKQTLPGFRPALQLAISAEGMQAWVEAAGAYASQLSTFWRDEEELRNALAGWDGGILWGR